MRKVALFAGAFVVLALFAVPSSAVPRLQTYIVGSEYEEYHSVMDQQSWISYKNNFDLRVVGYWEPDLNPDSPYYTGENYPCRDFMDTWVAISVPKCQSGTVWIDGVEISTFLAYEDAVPAGAHPAWFLRIMPPACMGNFYFYHIETPITNYQQNAWLYDHGTIHSPGWGDEVDLEVSIRGYSWTHFDAIGIDSRGVTFTNWFDHDATYFYPVPEPGTLSLLGLGLLGITPLLRKKKR